MCNPLHLTSIDEFIHFFSGQEYFQLILKPTRLSPENLLTKYFIFLDQITCRTVHCRTYSISNIGNTVGINGLTMICLPICLVIIYMKSPPNIKDPIRKSRLLLSDSCGNKFVRAASLIPVR